MLILQMALVLGWIVLSACVALGVAILSDRLLGTFSTSRTVPVGPPVRDQGRQPTQMEMTDV